MDVSPCNSLFDLRFLALVLSKTLNGSSEGKRKIEELEGPAIRRGLFVCVDGMHSRTLTPSAPPRSAFEGEVERPRFHRLIQGAEFIEVWGQP
jgi:hypothetical protein